MLIKFEIQLDGSSGAAIVQPVAQDQPPQNQAPQNQAVQKQLSNAFTANPGGDPPVKGPGTGPPSGTSSSGSSMLFVIGPIVICGSGPGHTGTAGGDPPVSGPNTKGAGAPEPQK